MKLSAAIILFVAIQCVLSPNARADDVADVSKLAHDFMVDLALMDFDKAEALARPGDSDTVPKPPDDVLSMVRDSRDLAQVQDIRRQLADEAGKAIGVGPPAFTPDKSCAIITATPVSAEARKFCELVVLYTTYMTAAKDSKAQGLPMPKVADIRARILAPGSPEQDDIDERIAAFPSEKLRLQFEKTPAGWRVNLHAFEKAIGHDDADTP